MSFELPQNGDFNLTHHLRVPVIGEPGAGEMVPLPDGRPLTPLEEALFAQYQAQADRVEPLAPHDADDAVRYRLGMVVPKVGGTLDAVVFAHEGEYAGARLSGWPVAHELGVAQATLFSRADGGLEGEQWVPQMAEIALDGLRRWDWHGLLPRRYGVGDRLARQIAKAGKAPMLRDIVEQHLREEY
ncbi:MAG TPA: hypothetical protein VF466_01570 [Candidatus Saccharimonadales bacterium]